MTYLPIKEDECDHECAGWGKCRLNAGHRGRHSHHDVHQCDWCGRRYRGTGKRAYYGREGDFDLICFMCWLGGP